MANSNAQNYKVPSTSKISVDKLLRVGYYELEQTIGKGNFAVVKLASNIVTKSKVAIKIIDKTCLNEEYLAKTFREISILKALRHPHITRLYEIMESQTMIYLVTEHAANGEIFDHLVEKGRMKEPEAARVFSQLVSAVQYCHAKGVVHRDLKAENVLLDKDMNIKLADFGFSNTYVEGSPLMTWCGSPPYAAPEVFQGLEYDGPKADIWSLGVVLYALVCGALPFDGKTLLDLKSRVVTGKFRIPYFMSQDCEHLIRNMLVVEPDRRYTLKQIIKHRWLSEWSAELENTLRYTCNGIVAINSTSCMSNKGRTNNTNPNVSESGNLDSVVMTHMLQLPGLTADMIAQSVHENRFDNIYAIYNLLYDKLLQKRQQQQKLQHHANLAFSRTRKTSITTGVVDRSEPIKQESIDRLSPLTNANSSSSGLLGGWADVTVDLEKFGDMELECLARPNEQQSSNQTYLSANCSGTSSGNTRRHTVGPGDVAHEQALANPNVPINFKCNDNDGRFLPINLPSLQNQPLHSLTIKDQHLLKPPTVMGATGGFGRRASDGGANLHIYYPSSTHNIQQPQVLPQTDGYYVNPNSSNAAARVGGIASDAVNDAALVSTPNGQNPGSVIVSGSHIPQTSFGGCTIGGDVGNEETSDEIQRYMQIRGCTKRHTFGCTDELSISNTPDNCAVDKPSHTPAPSQCSGGSGGGGRTRRTGLLTVMERPPVISPELIREVESRMNRNYLPPALKMQSPCSGLSQSPPAGSQCNPNPNYSNLPSTASSSASPASINSRRYGGRTCKLPTVQEVGRYSPVRRASEGSKAQFQGPLQECQYLQKGIAQRNLLVAPSPPLLENSISLPGSPIHGKPAPHMIFRRGQDIEIPIDAAMSLVPALDRLIKENRISVEIARGIMSTGVVPLNLATQLGLAAHSGGGQSYMDFNPMQQTYSLSVSPLSMPSTTIACFGGVGCTDAAGATSGPIVSGHSKNHMLNAFNKQNFLLDGGNLSHHMQLQQPGPNLVGGQFSNINSTGGLNSTTNSGSVCQSPIFSSYRGCSSPNSFMPPVYNTSVTSPLHQITKGISGLTTGGGGSITRGTSAASENGLNQPLDLSMDVCGNEGTSLDMYGTGSMVALCQDPCQDQQQSRAGNNWFMLGAYYDMKPLNLSSAQPVRIVPTPPASPNLFIIQEENANGQMNHTITSGTPYVANSGGIDVPPHSLHSHPQIFLTDVQGSETTLVPNSSENSRDSDCDSLEPHTSLISLQGLLITEPCSDMPSITRGVGRKASIESENNSRLETEPSISAGGCSSDDRCNRRGSDNSLGFSDDSLSNDSNNLSPCQEPSGSSGFKSDSHSDIGDQTESRLSPDSICDSRISEEYYEVPLPHECSNLDASRILEMVKQTIDSTMPPKGFILNKANFSSDTTATSSSFDVAATSRGNTSHHQMSSYSGVYGCGLNVSDDLSGKSSSSANKIVNFIGGAQGVDIPVDISNLSLEYSGGLQIELQVCEGRNKDNTGVCGKGIKLRRISGDQFEYGKLCQQLISTLTV